MVGDNHQCSSAKEFISENYDFVENKTDIMVSLYGSISLDLKIRKMGALLRSVVLGRGVAKNQGRSKYPS